MKFTKKAVTEFAKELSVKYGCIVPNVERDMDDNIISVWYPRFYDVEKVKHEWESEGFMDLGNNFLGRHLFSKQERK